MTFDEPLDMAKWWLRLTPDTREWLINNNGDAVPRHIIAEIVEAGGSISSEAWWSGETTPEGFHFSDEAVDWIETAANSELPGLPER
ncbi:hypothetical protein [Arthrobacter sp. SW1]|uniref:hypothetical protein n=1 Tax=Arthrobacter sp. SW1 TaxID=1920889 RepID=UPI00209B1EFB|nr:hypothetical protein [Arthrobacter sp. SW1]